MAKIEQIAKTRLELFQDAFGDEAILRGALHDLLIRLPNVTSVQLTHGPQEYGKDITFLGTGVLGEPIVSACVVKNVPITGKVDSPRGAAAVLNQVRQALSTAVIAADGSEQRVSRIYVMSPHAITQIALRSIQGQIEERFGQVVFVCGQALLDLFEKYYSEFLLLKAGFLTSYLTLLRRDIAAGGALEHLGVRHGMLAAAKLQTARAYVKPTFSVEVRSVKVSLNCSPGRMNLEASIKLEQLEQLERFFDNVIGLFEYYQGSEVGSLELTSKGVPLMSRARALKVNIRKKWEAGRKKRGEDQHATKVSVKGLQGQLDSAVEAVSSWCDRLGDASKDPVSYLESESQVLEALSSHQYKTYGLYRELAKNWSDICSLGPPIRTIQYSETLTDKITFPLLITAPAGYGKTSFCKWSALDDAERFAKGESVVIPVYIPLHRFAKGMPANFGEAFMSDVHLNSLLTRYRQGSGFDAKVRLYLDGLDEIPREQQKAVMVLLRTGPTAATGTQVLITARDHVTGEWLSWLPRVHIDRLQSEKVRVLVSQLLDDDPALTQEFFHQLDLVPSLRHLMGVPLLATIVVALFVGMTRLPDGRIELYRIFVDLLCGGWDTAKSLKRDSAFPSLDKQRILTRLASTLHHERTREANGDLIREVVKEVAPTHLRAWEGLVADMIQDGLIQREGNIFIFSHLSFQEYLCARDLADPGTVNAVEIVKSYLLGDDWWQEVLTFYVAMSQRLPSVKRIFLDLIDKEDPGFARSDIRQPLTERIRVEEATIGP